MVTNFSSKGIFIWVICAIFFLYEFFLRTILGAFQHPVMMDLDLTSFQFSLISTTVFLLIYGLMQIPAGIFIDNFGLKKSLLLGCTLCVVSSFGISKVDNFAWAVFFRFFMGFGSSFAFISILISVNEWIPGRFRGLFIGLSQFIGTIGAIAATGPVETLAESSNISWREIFLDLSIIGAFIGVLILLFVKNNEEHFGKFVILKKPEKPKMLIKRLFFRSQPWLIATLCACLYFSIEYLSENEGRAFLVSKGLSLSSSSFMLTVSWIGYAIGCPLLGYVSDYIQRRKIVMFASSIFLLIGTLGVLFIVEKNLLIISFFMLGLGASGQSVGFASIAEQFKKQFVAVGLGLNNAVIITTSSLNAPALGFVLDSIKNGPIPTNIEYIWVFSVLVVLAAIAFIISLFFIKESFCKSAVDYTVLKVK